MGRLLQAGVLLAATVVLAGGILYLFARAHERSNYRVFVAQPLRLRHPAAMLRGIARGDASAVIDLGILLLVATPICRVIFAVIAFVLEKDRLYIAVSASRAGGTALWDAARRLRAKTLARMSRAQGTGHGREQREWRPSWPPFGEMKPVESGR